MLPQTPLLALIIDGTGGRLNVLRFDSRGRTNPTKPPLYPAHRQPNSNQPSATETTHCRYISTVHPGYEEGKMSRIVSSSRCPKGRLLHYFPRSSTAPPESSSGDGGRGDDDTTGRVADAVDGVGGVGGDDTGGGAGPKSAGRDGGGGEVGEDDGAFSDWCGWHHDHSSLTGGSCSRGGDAMGTYRGHGVLL